MSNLVPSCISDNLVLTYTIHSFTYPINISWALFLCQVLYPLLFLSFLLYLPHFFHLFFLQGDKSSWTPLGQLLENIRSGLLNPLITGNAHWPLVLLSGLSLGLDFWAFQEVQHRSTVSLLSGRQDSHKSQCIPKPPPRSACLSAQAGSLALRVKLKRAWHRLLAPSLPFEQHSALEGCTCHSQSIVTKILLFLWMGQGRQEQTNDLSRKDWLYKASVIGRHLFQCSENQWALASEGRRRGSYLWAYEFQVQLPFRHSMSDDSFTVTVYEKPTIWYNDSGGFPEEETGAQ